MSFFRSNSPAQPPISPYRRIPDAQPAFTGTLPRPSRNLAYNDPTPGMFARDRVPPAPRSFGR